MDKKYNKNPLACVSESLIHGRGLFARCDIAAELVIGTYAGKKTSDNGMHVLWIWDENNEKWIGVDGDNEMRFLNHSTQPNAEFDDTDLYALRDITAGEEITFDYQWEEEDTDEDGVDQA
ncbi:MAG: SET domain-containing protein-lysine N-methyltransferase [Proteobacteria bacterium]|nr:SET domain-containing protein-lysine N-methyltransferase [Pseudomonadota bacterium]